MQQSFHHSGKAGYCRLFVPAYFDDILTEDMKLTRKELFYKYSDISTHFLFSTDSDEEEEELEDKEVDSNAYMEKNSDKFSIGDYDLRGDQVIEELITNIYHPKKVITMETDQLMLTDITELWSMFSQFDEDDLIAAAENYQPWKNSRPFSSSYFSPASSLSNVTSIHDAGNPPELNLNGDNVHNGDKVHSALVHVLDNSYHGK
jgi:hypothetical protein